MQSKPWYKSKTVLVNAGALALIGVQAMIGHAAIDPELQAALLSVVNVVLRLMTNQPVGR